MSHLNAEDASVNLPLFDLECVPPSIQVLFPFLRAQRDSPCVRRVYSVSMCIAIVRKDSQVTTARLSVAALAYQCLVVGDAVTGKITHCIRFANDVLGAFTAADDPTLIAIVVDGNSFGGDLLLSIPVRSEFNSILDVLQALYAHHAGSELPMKTLQTAQQLRGKVYLKSTEGSADELPFADVDYAPQQLWSVANLTAKATSDRMTNVKNTFAVVDRETKETVANMKNEVAKAERALAEAKSAAEESMAAAAEALQVEQARKLSLDATESEITRITEAQKRSVAEFAQLRVQYAEEEQRWSEILQTRQAEELQQRKTLVDQQRSNERTVNLLRQDIADCQASNKLATAEIAAYESDSYNALCCDRDNWLVKLAELTAELEGLHSKDTEQVKKSFTAALEDVLQTNSALRELLGTTATEFEAEEQRQLDLLTDIDSFGVELGVFSSSELQLAAKANAVHDELEERRLEVEALEKEIRGIEDQLKQNQESRSFFLVAREKLSAAINRRTQLENVAKSQRAEHHSRRVALQQRIFEEKMKRIHHRFGDDHSRK